MYNALCKYLNTLRNFLCLYYTKHFGILLTPTLSYLVSKTDLKMYTKSQDIY